MGVSSEVGKDSEMLCCGWTAALPCITLPEEVQGPNQPALGCKSRVLDGSCDLAFSVQQKRLWCDGK